MSPTGGRVLGARARVLRAAAVVALTLAFAELCAFALIRGHIAPNYPLFFRLDTERLLATITDEHIDAARRRSWDPELGWELARDERRTHDDGRGHVWSHTTDGDGGRITPYESDETLIATFGESFTFCDEVEDDQTWQYRLSVLTDSRVLNFGVGGYGIDQAALKARRKLEGGLRTPFVVLGIQTIDLARSLNAWRTLLQPQDIGRLDFKPLVAPVDGAYRWIPNPLATLDGRDDVLRAFDVARRHDYWYANRVLRNEFPFVLDAGRLFLILSGLRPNPRYDQWDNEDAKARLETAIDVFVREAAQRGITPVILVIPSWRDVRGRTEGVTPRSRSFFEASRARHEGSGVILVDVLERPFDESRFYRSEFGHASPYGNEVIAAALHAALEAKLSAWREGRAQDVGR